MSKSKYNGIDPQEVIEEYGIDTTRLLSMADVAPVSFRKWQTTRKYLKVLKGHSVFYVPNFQKYK